MGRVRRAIPRSRVPLHRLLRTNPELIRRWLLVAVLAGLTAVAVGRSISAGEAARAQWGHTREVLVVTAPVAANTSFHGKLATRRWPEALMPAGTVTDLPAGARASVDLDAGMPITDALVVGVDTDPAAAARVRVAVPLGPASMTFEEGERVDLWSTVDPSLGDPLGGGRGVRTVRVASRAIVLADPDRSRVVVAVEATEAEAVVQAVASSTVTPTVVGGG